MRLLSTIVGALLFVTNSAGAVPVFLNAATVGIPQRSATFSTLASDGLDLSIYQEDLLLVTVAGTSRQGQCSRPSSSFSAMAWPVAPPP